MALSKEGLMPETPRDSPADLLASLRRLSDDELVARLKGLAARERRATALLVAHLAELDARDVHLRAGYSSLFPYCRDVLALSDGEAYNRIEVARAARRFPAILELLASGEVSLTAARLLAPHLTPENHSSVLESARGRRKAEVEEIVARLSPRPDAPASVRKLPASKAATSSPLIGLEVLAPAVEGHVASSDTTAGPGHALLAQARRSADVRPLSPDRYRYQLTIGGTTLEKLRLAKDMLRHAVPSGDDEAVLGRALDALLVDLARKKFGARRQDASPAEEAVSPADPVAGSGRVAAPGSRDVPVAVRRAVWVRDLGRCAFVGTGGHRCEARAFLEFHHVRPYAAGGEPTVQNVQLRCGRHNRYEERVYFAREEVADDCSGPGIGARRWASNRTGRAFGTCSGTSPVRGEPAVGAS
jgi:hypothetical protein